MGYKHTLPFWMIIEYRQILMLLIPLKVFKSSWSTRRALVHSAPEHILDYNALSPSFIQMDVEETRPQLYQETKLLLRRR